MPHLETEDVLLESQDGIAQLLFTWKPPRHGGKSSVAPAPPVGPVERRSRSHRCSCGVCPRCQDNARWERIFNEKFADPTYYGGILVRHHSSLAGL